METTATLTMDTIEQRLAQGEATNAEAGVVIESGPRVGASTVEAILCHGVIEVTGRTADGTPVNMGRRSRAIPPRLRRFVLARDGGVCTAEGCISRYRLQPHHMPEEVLSTEYPVLSTPPKAVNHRPLHATPTTTIPPTMDPRPTPTRVHR